MQTPSAAQLLCALKRLHRLEHTARSSWVHNIETNMKDHVNAYKELRPILGQEFEQLLSNPYTHPTTIINAIFAKIP